MTPMTTQWIPDFLDWVQMQAGEEEWDVVWFVAAEWMNVFPAAPSPKTLSQLQPSVGP
jgi:hypothetical protein